MSSQSVLTHEYCISYFFA